MGDADLCAQCSFYVGEDDMMEWKSVLTGPAGSPYAGGNFVISISFPPNYPFKPPKIRFLTPIYHCNISGDGALCLDVLKDGWSPALNIGKVMSMILLLLEHPNVSD